MELETVIYEVVESVGVITLNRPEAANSQTHKALQEMDLAWKEADRDPAVKVIVFKSNGKHFSAGHDLTGVGRDPNAPSKYTVDWLYDWETRGYLNYAKTWREIPKPSIAAVQGKCIAGGLMLCWPCDLIIAADNAQFSDPVLSMGICGVELHAHAWEFGARKAKEILFTGDSVTAQQAEQLGMVNKVVPLEELVPATMALAQRIARQDTFALRMAKRAVNRTQDIQGYTASVDAIFDMHHIGHARAALMTGGIPALMGLNAMKNKGKEGSER